MFGNYFYHQRIRKAVATFGAMFNDIYVLRKDAAGGVISTQKVPLSYGPRAKFLDRIREVPDLEERRVAIKLPRMSFEIMNISYDPARQLPKGNITARPGVAGTVLSRNKIEVGVPYIISFQLSVFAKLQDDALQCVEQILPYFTPAYTLTINAVPEMGIKQDFPVILNSLSYEDDYEGDFATRRSIVYTLTFTVKTNFYGPVEKQGIIKKARIDQYTNINEGVTDVDDLRYEVVPDPTDAEADDDFGFTETITENPSSAT